MAELSELSLLVNCRWWGEYIGAKSTRAEWKIPL